MSRALEGPWPPLGLALLALVGLGAPSHPPGSPEPDRGPGLTDVEALQHLSPGDVMGGWSVVRIDSEDEGALEITVRRDGRSFVVSVAPIGLSNPARTPPRIASNRAIYYGSVQPRGAALQPEDWDPVLAEVGRRIEASSLP